MLLFSLFFAAAAAEWKPTVSLEGINEYALPNGMRVLTFPDASKATVTVNVTYFVGSRHEGYGETGMAHLLEHMLFKGTPTTKDVPKALSERGARANGTTWLDRTNYYETLQASDENTEWALRFEADRMVNSFVAKKDLDSEMSVVRNELEAGENNPKTVLRQRAVSLAYLWHNYGHATIGARSDVEHVPIERLQAFYKQYYQPDNAMLVVAGKFDEAKVLAWIKDSFGKLPKPSRALPQTYTSEPTQDGERSVTLRRTGDVQAVMAVYHIPPGSHADAAAIEILASLHGNTPSGRLYKALVETKRAASVFGWTFQQREPGVMLFGAEVRKEQPLDAARDALLKTLEDKKIFTEKEVERAKAEEAKDFDLTLNDSQRLALQLTEWAALGDWRLYFVQRDRIAAVTLEDVQRVAASYLKPSNRTLGLFVPTDKPVRAEIPAAPDIAALVNGFKGREAVATGESFDASPLAIDKRVKRSVLPSGVKLALLPKKTRAEMVHFALVLHVGSDKTLFAKDIAATFAAEMLMHGTKRRTREQLKDELDRLKAQLRVGGDVNIEVALEVEKKNLAATLAILREVLREPRFDAKELEQLREAWLAHFEGMKQDPQAIGHVAYEKRVDPWPKGHPLYSQDPDEVIASLKALKLDEVKAFYRDFYSSLGAELSLVGDFDEAVVMDFAKAALSDWKAKNAYVRIARPFRPALAERVLIEVPEKANAFFMAGLHLELADSDADYPALVLGNYLLGGGFLSSRLGRIRTRDGLSYGVGSYLHPGALDKNTELTAYAIYAPENRAAVEKAFDAEIAKALADGFSDDELKAAKTGWAQMRQVQRGQDAALAKQLVTQEYNGRSFAFDAELEAKVAALDAKTVNAVLRKYLVPEKLVKVFAGAFQKK